MFELLEFLFEPYNRKDVFSLVSSFEKEGSRLRRLLKSSDLWIEKHWQRKKKYSVVSTSDPHGHIGSAESLNPCLNLCSFKWEN